MAKEAARTSTEGGLAVAGYPADDDAIIWPLLDIAGFSCFVAWSLIVSWQVINFEPLNATAGVLDALGLRLFFFAGEALMVLLLLFVRSDFILPTLRQPIRMSASSRVLGIPFLLCCCVSLPFVFEMPYIASCGLWLFSGIGMAWVLLIWNERLTIFSRRQAFATSSASLMIAGAALIVSSFIQADSLRFTVSCLPIMSLVFFLLACRKYNYEDEEVVDGTLRFNPISFKAVSQEITKEEDRRMLRLKGAFVALYSSLLAYLLCLSVTDYTMPYGSISMGTGCLATAILLFYFLRKNPIKINNMITQYILPVACVSYFVCFVAWPSYLCFLAVALLATAYSALDQFGGYTAREYSETEPARCYWECVFGLIGNSLGFLFGWLTALILKSVLPMEHEGFLVAAFLIVTLGVIADSHLFKSMLLSVNNKEVDGGRVIEIIMPASAPQLGVLDGGNRQETACREIASEYGLTKRQEEVLSYLIRGRNINYIKEKLVLSTPTVKSHTYKIYQKTGVHSHQELLDLAEHYIADK